MAMGGYRSKETLKSGTVKDKEDPAPPVFPASTRPSVPGTGLVSPDTRGAYTYPRGNRASIEFAKTQEVELLWLETVKVHLSLIPVPVPVLLLILARVLVPIATVD